jgi:hypothetical protein
MDDTPKGWKEKAKRPAKYAGGATLAGVLMFAATEGRGLVIDYVRATEKQAEAVEQASKKFDRGIRLVERKTERELRRLEEREDRKDERVFLELQAQRRDIRDLRHLILEGRQSYESEVGRSALRPRQKQTESDG